MVVADPASPPIPPWLKIVLALLALVGSIAGAAIYVHDMKTDVTDIKKNSTEILEKVEPTELEPLPSPATTTAEVARTLPKSTVEGQAVVLKRFSGETSCGDQVAESDEYAASYQLECGTTVRVLNFTTEKSAVFRIKDKAGSRRTWDAIKLALSPAAAEKLQVSGRAAIRYTVESVPSAQP